MWKEGPEEEERKRYQEVMGFMEMSQYENDEDNN